MKHKYGHPRFDCISNENIKAAIELADTYLSDNGIESVKRRTVALRWRRCCCTVKTAF